MKITVDIPDQIILEERDSIDLVVGNWLGRITVQGDGMIIFHGNGGGALSFTVDVKQVMEELRSPVVKLI